jgi:hypothetical protein
MLVNFYLVKNKKNINNSTITKAREKINTDLESIKLYDVMYIIEKSAHASKMHTLILKRFLME